MIKAILVGIITTLVFMITGYGQTPSRADLLKTIKHIETLAIETQQELNAEKGAHAQTKTALAAAQQAKADTQNQFDAYRKAAETEIEQGNKCIVSMAQLVKKHHLDFIILIGLWIGLIALLYLRLGGLSLGIPGLVGVGVIASAGIGAILWRL